MQINEIEIQGASLSLRHHIISASDIAQTFKMLARADEFNMESEIPGIHDYESDGEMIRGFYSVVTPFEIEYLIDGMSQKRYSSALKAANSLLPPRRCYRGAVQAHQNCYLVLFRLQQASMSVWPNMTSISFRGCKSL